jgi:2-hydroxy-6-oxonona-2,4-dienedioate hydrolase
MERDEEYRPGDIELIECGGVRTRIYSRGSGEPLLLVHGGRFGSYYSLDSWARNLASLAGSFRVVAWDKLGQGHTDGPRDDAGFTFEALYAHTLAVVEAVAPEPAHVVGHSLGALPATRLALDHPERVRSLTIVDSNSAAPDDERYPWKAFYLELEHELSRRRGRDQVTVEPLAQSYAADHVTPVWRRRMQEIAASAGHREVVARLAGVRDSVWLPSIEDARAQLHRDLARAAPSAPTLVVWGAADPSAPLPLALALLELLTRGGGSPELHVLSRAGHYCFRERPSAFERALRSFCSSPP